MSVAHIKSTRSVVRTLKLWTRDIWRHASMERVAEMVDRAIKESGIDTSKPYTYDYDAVERAWIATQDGELMLGE